MKESRVSKYQQYRDSISKEDSKSFLAPSKDEEVSPEMRLFLKMKRKQTMENITLLSICLAIIIVITVFGFVLF